MNHKDEIKQELSVLLETAVKLKRIIGNSARLVDFGKRYQEWYSRAIRIVSVLAADRIDEFRSYYEHDPKRKSMGKLSYRIQDYLNGYEPPMEIYRNPDWDVPDHVILIFQNQVSILASLLSRIDGVLSNIETAAFAAIYDEQLSTASLLQKTSLRAAGALAGVVLESHLQHIASAHSIKLRKARPTMSDLNDPLRDAQVYDTATWRKIQYLADIRNLCSHDKGREPTESEVSELLGGTN